MASTQASPALSTRVTADKSRVSCGRWRSSASAGARAVTTLSNTSDPATSRVAGSARLTRTSGLGILLGLRLANAGGVLGFQTLDQIGQPFLANFRVHLVAIIGNVGN